MALSQAVAVSGRVVARRVPVAGARSVRVRLGGDPASLRAAPLHESEDAIDVAAGRAVDVAAVHVRAGLGRRPHDLGRPVDRHLGVGVDELAGVSEHRPSGSGCRIGDREVLVGGGAGRISHEHTDQASLFALAQTEPGHTYKETEKEVTVLTA